jgi:N-acetylglucosaminyldiphosphoundecaprenol N-acetyl-beta-D-mannosaminyltransferase
MTHGKRLASPGRGPTLPLVLRPADPRLAPPIFGIVPSALDAAAVADLVLHRRRTPLEGVGSIVTPNIQHIALMRHDPEFAEAVRSADLRLCDGFPVFRYAAVRGHRLPGRAAGREIVARIMADLQALAEHRLLALVDQVPVAEALTAWAERHGLGDRVRAVVAPPAFLADEAAQAALIAEMRDFGTSIALLCLGAPTCELFVHRHRDTLPPCWALSIGQSVKIALGLVPTPPAALVRLNLEWAWRIGLEPRRMIRRYVPAAAGFLAAVANDLRGR